MFDEKQKEELDRVLIEALKIGFDKGSLDPIPLSLRKNVVESWLDGYRKAAMYFSKTGHGYIDLV